MLSFKIIINQKENLHYFQKYILTEKNDKKYKEYMLTFLTEFIKTKSIPISKDLIRNYFKLYGEKSIASYEKSYITYNINKNCFTLIYQFEDGILKKDEYNYYVINELIEYTYKNSIYESGRLL